MTEYPAPADPDWGRHGGRGIVRKRLAIPLCVGARTHRGLQSLLDQYKAGVFSAGWVAHFADEAVGVALEGYQREVKDRGFDEQNEDVALVVAEQGALIEGLIRAYAARALGELLLDYEVLEVEQEDILPLGGIGDDELLWQSRPDGLLRERSSGDLYVLSFKTAASWDQRKEKEALHDMQGMSEVAAVEHRLGEQVMGVKMEYLLKGERRLDQSGRLTQYSSLIRAWRTTSQPRKYAWRWEWKEEDPLSGASQSRRLSPKTYEPFRVWESEEVGGIKGWIEMLNSGAIQPEAGDCLAGQIVRPFPYFRDAEQIRDWREQITAQEFRVIEDADWIRAVSHKPGVSGTPGLVARRYINEQFPQHTEQCHIRADCPYTYACWSPEVGKDPIGSGLYVTRIPHHAPERLSLGVSSDV